MKEDIFVANKYITLKGYWDFQLDLLHKFYQYNHKPAPAIFGLVNYLV